MIIETGDGIANADSYAGLALASSYNEARGVERWDDADTPEQTAGLLIATDFLETHYRAVGAPLRADQGLQWPTFTHGLPRAVIRATLVLAAAALDGPLDRPVERGVKSIKLSGEGVGSRETVYDDAPDGDPFPHVTAMLSGLATRIGDPEPNVATMGRLTR